MGWRREMWRRILGICVAATAFSSFVFSVTEDVPVVQLYLLYGLLSLAGLIPLRWMQPTAGPAYYTILNAAFILVHFPFTPLGPEGSACSQCDRLVLWGLLFAMPLEFLICSAMAWRGLAKYGEGEFSLSPSLSPERSQAQKGAVPPARTREPSPEEAMADNPLWDFSLQFPPAWLVNDNNHATRADSAVRSVDRYITEFPEYAPYREALIEKLIDFGSVADEKFGYIAAMTWQLVEGVEVTANFMVFDAVRRAPHSAEAELGILRDELARPAPGDLGPRDVRLVELGEDRVQAVRVRFLNETSSAEDGSTLAVDNVDHYVPIPGHPDMLILGGATPSLAFADELAEAFDVIADTLKLMLDQPGLQAEDERHSATEPTDAAGLGNTTSDGGAGRSR